MAWTNNDGLVVRFGTEEATHGNRGGSIAEAPGMVMELRINATELTSTAVPLNESILTLPKGLRIEKVEIIVETAFTSGGSAVLDVGLLTLARGAFGTTAIVAAQTVASLAADANITLTPASGTAGTWVGEVLTQPTIVVANYTTAAFTAGKALVRIHGYMPLA